LAQAMSLLPVPWTFWNERCIREQDMCLYVTGTAPEKTWSHFPIGLRTPLNNNSDGFAIASAMNVQNVGKWRPQPNRLLEAQAQLRAAASTGSLPFPSTTQPPSQLLDKALRELKEGKEPDPALLELPRLQPSRGKGLSAAKGLSASAPALHGLKVAAPRMHGHIISELPDDSILTTQMRVSSSRWRPSRSATREMRRSPDAAEERKRRKREKARMLQTF